MQTYQVWNGECWAFEQVVEDLAQLVRSIVAKTTPDVKNGVKCPQITGNKCPLNTGEKVI